MKNRGLFEIINYFISIVWIVNGLYCKILNFVPRHQQIVERILGKNYSREITILIGISEIVMAIWILCGFQRQINVVTQIIIIFSMNLLEFILASDLLLWGKFNAAFASVFILIIYFNAFRVPQRQN